MKSIWCSRKKSGNIINNLFWLEIHSKKLANTMKYFSLNSRLLEKKVEFYDESA